MFDRERARTRARGVRISDAESALASSDTFFCEALTDAKRCAVYDVRPLICRLWGAVEDMPCPYGCTPEPRFLTTQEAMILLSQAHAVAGLRGHALTEDDLRKIASKATMDLAARFAQRGWESGRHGIELRANDQVPPGLRRSAAEPVTRVQRERTQEIAVKTQGAKTPLTSAIDALNQASREASQQKRRRR